MFSIFDILDFFVIIAIEFSLYSKYFVKNLQFLDHTESHIKSKITNTFVNMLLTKIILMCSEI